MSIRSETRRFARRARQTVAMILAVTLVAWSAGPAHADYLPASPEQFVERVSRFVENSQRPMLLGLYNWYGVDTDHRKALEEQIDTILGLEIISVELADGNAGLTREFEKNGKTYWFNADPANLVVFKVAVQDGSRDITVPFGQTPLGYAFTAAVPKSFQLAAEGKTDAQAQKVVEPDSKAVAESDAAPAAVKPGLEVSIRAQSGVITEIACAYYALDDGSRQILTLKADGNLNEQIPGSSFETCAAKKRSGNGNTEVSLKENGVLVFSESSSAIDAAMVYRQP